MKQERNVSPQLVIAIQAQHQQTQHDEVDDLYDYHAQMEVHDGATIDVHAIQPQINWQQP